MSQFLIHPTMIILLLHKKVACLTLSYQILYRRKTSKWEIVMGYLAAEVDEPPKADAAGQAQEPASKEKAAQRSMEDVTGERLKEKGLDGAQKLDKNVTATGAT